MDKKGTKKKAAFVGPKRPLTRGATDDWGPSLEEVQMRWMDNARKEHYFGGAQSALLPILIGLMEARGGAGGRFMGGKGVGDMGMTGTGMGMTDALYENLEPRMKERVPFPYGGWIWQRDKGKK